MKRKSKKPIIKKVISVRPNTSVWEAARILASKKISGLPVLDKDNKLCGIISEKDLLWLFFGEHYSKRVEDYMTKDVICFKETDTIYDICKFLIGSTVRRVPIVDTENRLVGIMSRHDIINFILTHKKNKKAK